MSSQVVGESGVGGMGVSYPPLVPGGGGRRCHSLVNRMDDPSVFVVQVPSPSRCESDLVLSPITDDDHASGVSKGG